MSWSCPVCQAPLKLSGAQWQCENKHCYDRAKAGYVNLLLANQKRSPEPGDSKEMITARRAFLEQDHYLPLVSALADLIRQHHGKPTLALYDTGCGEGYYLGNIVSLLSQPELAISAAGSDISKAAIEKAAKKYPQLHFAIASNFNLPVPNDSQDMVLQVFAPGSAEEIHRILAVGGLWLHVSPAEEHLAQLKAALYETPQQHAVDAEIPAGFEELPGIRLRYEFSLPQLQSRKELLMMTPYYWSVEEGAMASVLERMSELSADFSIRVLRKEKGEKGVRFILGKR